MHIEGLPEELNPNLTEVLAWLQGQDVVPADLLPAYVWRYAVLGTCSTLKPFAQQISVLMTTISRNRLGYCRTEHGYCFSLDRECDLLSGAELQSF